jgi:hypothetical protein
MRTSGLVSILYSLGFLKTHLSSQNRPEPPQAPKISSPRATPRLPWSTPVEEGEERKLGALFASSDPSAAVEGDESRIRSVRGQRLVHIELPVPDIHGEIGDVGYRAIPARGTIGVVDVLGPIEGLRAP